MVFKMATVFDIQAAHPLYPRREILAEYENVKMEYEKTVHDRKYEWWHAQTRGRATRPEITQIYRKKIAKEGEYLLYNITWRGTDWKGNEEEFSTLMGRYEKPIFRIEKNPQTQEVSSSQVQGHKTIHDIPYTKERLDELLDIASEPVSLIVFGVGNRRYTVQSLEDYKNGSIEDLVTCADKGKSLDTVLAERNQFTYEKREQKDRAKKDKDTNKEQSAG